MRKRIFLNISLVVMVTVLMLTAVVSLLIGMRLTKEIKDSLKSLRVTIISDDGEVKYDTVKKELDNHANRPEVKEAQENGFGESERYSDTLGEKTYYYALRMPDNTILRLSLTTKSTYTWFYSIAPLVVICIIIVLWLSLMLANRLTKGIVTPINTLDLDNITTLPYDELAPFVAKIEAQKSEIRSQLSALKDRADTITAITENMKEGLIIVDNDGIILSSNKSVEEIFEDNNMSGKSILHVSRNLQFLENAKKALEGERSEMTFAHRQRTYMVYISPVTQHEMLNGAIIMFLDISDRVLAERQRMEFSANVSHELKTPLTTISGLSEMILNDMAKPEDIKDFVGKINAQAARLLMLIDDIIKLSEFDEGRAGDSGNYEIFDVCELARVCMDSLTQAALDKRVSLSPPPSSIEIKANKRMVDELLFNLIDNGIKYNKEEGRLEVDISRSGQYILIAVTDTGIGIEPEHQNRIFERFYRVDKSRSKRTGGTGLGLSIVKHIAEYHNGYVQIESTPGKGTTVKCFLGVI